jgi:hypothetical protein
MEDLMKINGTSLFCLFVMLLGVILIPSRIAPAQVDGYGLDPAMLQTPKLVNTSADDKVPVPWRRISVMDPASQAEMLTLGSTWEVTECCGWTGTWKRRPGTNTFDGTWRHTNGTVVNDTVKLGHWDKANNNVQLIRTYNNGVYWGTLNPANGTISGGGASWYPAGTTWSATFFATPQDPKGPVRVTIRH